MACLCYTGVCIVKLSLISVVTRETRHRTIYELNDSSFWLILHVDSGKSDK